MHSGAPRDSYRPAQLPAPWLGPLEPFDSSFAEVLRAAGVYSHLITDHYHYFEDGGFGYHGRYDTYEFIRGQEKDKWRSLIEPGLEDYEQRFVAEQRDTSTDPNGKTAYYANHRELIRTGDFPLTQCFDRAISFVDAHAGSDNWLLHLECFDPHEPFFLGSEDEYENPEVLGGKIFDWPAYGRVGVDDDALAALRTRYQSLVQRCDHELGRLIDCLDENDLWDDVVVVLTTDHGLLLGEKEFLGKNRPPFFNEVARIPLIIAAPERVRGDRHRISGLTQTIDLMPTFLDTFGLKPAADIGGRSLLPCLRGEATGTRNGVLFGQFGAALNFTDGRYSYFRYPAAEDGELYQYTLMPTHMRTFFEGKEFEGAEVVDDLAFARGFPVWRLKMHPEAKANMVARYPLLDASDVLYDLMTDPVQEHPIVDRDIVAMCERHMAQLLKDSQAPTEVFARFGLAGPA